MRWFEEQLRERIEKDEAQYQEALFALHNIGKKGKGGAGEHNPLKQIAEYYQWEKTGDNRVTACDSQWKQAATMQEAEELLGQNLLPEGIYYRKAELTENWYRHCVGAMLGQTKEGKLIALLPGSGGYWFFSEKQGKNIKINKKNQGEIGTKVLCFYPSLGREKMGGRALLRFCVRVSSEREYALFFTAGMAEIFTGMLLPWIVQRLFAKEGLLKADLLLPGLFLALFLIAVSRGIFAALKHTLLKRIQSAWRFYSQSGFVTRLLWIPPSFAKDQSTGELAGSIETGAGGLGKLAEAGLQGVLLGTGFLLYLFQLWVLTPALFGTVCVWSLLCAGVLTAGTCAGIQRGKAQRRLRRKTLGMEFGMYEGVGKWKLSGSEKRVFAKWSRLYKQKAEALYGMPWYLRCFEAVFKGFINAGWVLFLYGAWRKGLSPEEFLVFSGSWTLLLGILLQAEKISRQAAEGLCDLSLTLPLLQEIPTVQKGKIQVKKLSGKIEFSHAAFRYPGENRYILEDLSFSVKEGEYIGIVGKTGSGKSTLLRLLLGLETLEKGRILYDGRALDTLDLTSVQRRIGFVLQDSALFSGDLLSNITAASDTDMEKAWEAAETADLAEDIRQMPMGMFTLLNEGGTLLSGGQRQRILIARAVYGNPDILLFDEASSALDNLSQKKVGKALAQMECTRITVAHRLSAIKDCHRILVLDGGRIAEEGSYEELLKKKGIFYDLASRQEIL